jgi:hypothetical protein
MEMVKENKEFKIYKKASGRYCVLDLKTRKYVNADKKVEVLLANGLIKLTPKKKEEAPAAEAAPAAE